MIIMPKDLGYLGMAISGFLFFGAASRVPILRPLAIKFFALIIVLLVCGGLFLYVGKRYNAPAAWLSASGLFVLSFMILGAI